MDLQSDVHARSHTGASEWWRWFVNGADMMTLAKALTGLSGVAFVLAIVTNFTGSFLTTAEGYSRAAANLALLALALALCWREDGRP